MTNEIRTAFGPAVIVDRRNAASSINRNGRPYIKIRITSGPEAGKVTWIPSGN